LVVALVALLAQLAVEVRVVVVALPVLLVVISLSLVLPAVAAPRLARIRGLVALG